MNVADRLRGLRTGACRLFQTGLANELDFLECQVYEARGELRKAVDALIDARTQDAQQASANQINAAMAVASLVRDEGKS
jgi:hypothetical protein